MNNYQWLLQMDGAERKAWFDAEHVENQERALDGDTAALNAKIAELERKLRISWEYECKFQAERDELKELNEYHALQYELASEDADRLQAQADELTAERDNLADDLLIANKQREWYREKFGKCLDYADAIHALMDDEGMA